MTEVEREAVLYERAQARLAKAERRELEKKMRELESAGSRPARGPSATMEKKRRTLDELCARREKKMRRNNDSDYYDSDDDRGEEGEVVRESRRRRGGPVSDDEYEEEASYGRKSKVSPKKGTTEPIDLGFANSLQLTRNTVSKWMFHPQFDDLARGCLMRLAISDNKYRLVEVKKLVKYHRNYKINDLTTNKAALLKYGKSEKTFRMDVISNSPFTQTEFDRWMETLKEEHQPIMPRRTAEDRVAHWRELESTPLSDEVVSAMVAAKRELGAAPRNLIAERTMLLHLRDEALHNGVGTEEIERIDEELAQLAKEQAAQPARQNGDTRLEALAELNRRNRQLNVTLAREAERKNTKRTEAENRLDPFSRRRCQPTDFNTYFADESGAAPELVSAPAASTSNMTTPDRVEESSSPSTESQGGVSSPPEELVPAGPIDLFAAAHNVDIEIDI
jgi:RNA polymerase-associated protein RTF1